MADNEIWAFKSQEALPFPILALQNNHITEHNIDHRVYHATITKMYKLVGLVLFSVCFTTVFARNDTILHGWHSESHERGTWSILWGCLATIFICTWSVLHLGVPPRSASDLRRLILKVEGTLLAIIAPEYILTVAINDTLKSRILKKKLSRQVDTQQGQKAWSLTHLRFMADNGFAKNTESDDVWDPLELEELLNLPQEPPISKKELKSRSTTDWIANTLALFQISWFGAQLLVRRIQHLHITAMEILTLAFIVCSVFTFILCWPQPQNVAYPVVLSPLEVTPLERPATTSPEAPLSEAAEDPPHDTLLYNVEGESNKTTNPLGHPPDGSEALDKSDDVQKRASDFSNAFERVSIISSFLLAFAGSIFGAVHCLAWNSTFPTPKERLAWRVCSVATTALPAVGIPAYISDWSGDRFLGFPLLVAYVIARLTLIALALASLRAVPADVFQTTAWNNIIPHVGL